MSIIIELGAIILVSYLADKWLSGKTKEGKEELEEDKKNVEKTAD